MSATKSRSRTQPHWRFYALQTEEERGESGFALPIEIDSSRDITFANFHGYRVISSFQPFPWAVKVSNSQDIRFRNFHCDSNSKVSFDSSVYDQSHNIEIRQHEFAWLDLSGQGTPPRHATLSPVVARGAKVEKLAGGFFNISGGAAGRTAISISWIRIGNGSIAGLRRHGNSPPSVIIRWSRSTWPWTRRVI